MCRSCRHSARVPRVSVLVGGTTSTFVRTQEQVCQSDTSTRAASRSKRSLLATRISHTRFPHTRKRPPRPAIPMTLLVTQFEARIAKVVDEYGISVLAGSCVMMP